MPAEIDQNTLLKNILKILHFQNTSEVYEPMADKLAIKHKSVPNTPNPLPFIYVYHRSTRY